MLPFCPQTVHAVLSRLKGRFFFGDLVCKWYAWVAKVVDNISLKSAAGDAEVARLIEQLPVELVLTQQQVQDITPATSAMHSTTHVWWCQVGRWCVSAGNVL